jgi:hypothetical protein
MLFRSDLWEAIALGVTAENRKIEIFIHHNLSRGIARETLLRKIIVQHTAHPFLVRSGFVYTDDQTLNPHKQCDVLVYNPRVWQPYYQIDEFVVASPDSSVLIVEVKSTIGDDEFTDIRNMQAYAQGVHKPLLGFVYGGWTFSTFCEKVRPFASNLSSLPICIVVHERNYLAVRPTLTEHPICLLIDFSQSNPSSPGIATAYFLNIYDLLVRSFERRAQDQALPDGLLLDWFRHTLTVVPPAAKRWLTPDGVLHSMANSP